MFQNRGVRQNRISILEQLLQEEKQVPDESFGLFGLRGWKQNRGDQFGFVFNLSQPLLELLLNELEGDVFLMHYVAQPHELGHKEHQRRTKLSIVPADFRKLVKTDCRFISIE